MRIETTQVFRDVSAWYHLVVAIDTTQATSTDRVKLYLNGSQITALSTTTYPNQNFDTDVNNTNAHYVGSLSTSQYHNGYLTAFNLDGFSLGTDANYNGSARTYIAWNWNAGGSNQTISVGQYATSPANVPSIASTVRANTTSGFSIVTYTGNGSSGATIGHGLGVAPSFYVVKNRGSANKDWECYHISLGNTKRIRLNVTAAADTGGTMWANTSPTSTVFSVGSDADVNASTNTYVAYCFAPVAGYSAFGSYTGNGSTDGPFVYTGFRPRYILTKVSSTTGSWLIHDTVRDPYNVSNLELQADTSLAEYNTNTAGAGDRFDILSNGFKNRSSNSGANASGTTYIYAAFAEAPFKYALAR